MKLSFLIPTLTMAAPQKIVGVNGYRGARALQRMFTDCSVIKTLEDYKDLEKDLMDDGWRRGVIKRAYRKFVDKDCFGVSIEMYRP